MNAGITVDYTNIAKSLYAMFTESERAVLAFGMLPESKMSIFRKTLTSKAAELFPMPEDLFDANTLAEMECIGLRKSGADLATSERKEWIKETEHQVALALYGVAPMCV